MPTTSAAPGGSLRERKREGTRDTLTLAAYTILRDEGLEAVTADAVATRAGVSRRTFFNYFPSVESVLTASVEEFFTSLGEQLEARPEQESPRQALLALLEGPSDHDLLERVGVLAAAGESSTHAKALILTELHSWLDWLEGWLRRRLGDQPTEMQVAVLASSVVAAGEAALRVWSRHLEQGTPTSIRSTLTEAIGLLGTHLLPDDTAVVERS